METFNDHLEILANHVFDNDKLVISIFDIINFQISYYSIILSM